MGEKTIDLDDVDLIGDSGIASSIDDVDLIGDSGIASSIDVADLIGDSGIASSIDDVDLIGDSGVKPGIDFVGEVEPVTTNGEPMTEGLSMIRSTEIKDETSGNGEDPKNSNKS